MPVSVTRGGRFNIIPVCCRVETVMSSSRFASISGRNQTLAHVTPCLCLIVHLQDRIPRQGIQGYII